MFVERGPDPAGEVVVAPPGLDQDDGCAWCEAGECDFAPEVFDRLFPGLGVGLFRVLVGVVDDQEVDGSGGEGSADADADDAAAVAETALDVRRL